MARLVSLPHLIDLMDAHLKWPALQNYLQESSVTHCVQAMPLSCPASAFSIYVDDFTIHTLLRIKILFSPKTSGVRICIYTVRCGFPNYHVFLHCIVHPDYVAVFMPGHRCLSKGISAVSLGSVCTTTFKSKPLITLPLWRRVLFVLFCRPQFSSRKFKRKAFWSHVKCANLLTYSK